MRITETRNSLPFTKYVEDRTLGPVAKLLVEQARKTSQKDAKQLEILLSSDKGDERRAMTKRINMLVKLSTLG